MLDLSAALQTFVAVFPAELPDKTMVVTIVLVARYRRPLAVWLGTSAAYLLHVTVAVAAGSLLTLLPDAAVAVATAVLFLVGAVLLWRSATAHAREAEEEVDAASGELGGTSARRTALASFGLVGVAEWGDLSQLVIAGLTGRTGAPVAAGIGGLAGMLAVSAIAVVTGHSLVKRLPLVGLQRAAAGIFTFLAVVSLSGLL